MDGFQTENEAVFGNRLRRNCSGFGTLTDEELIHCYRMAVRLKLEPDFIRMITVEMEKRKLFLHDRMLDDGMMDDHYTAV